MSITPRLNLPYIMPAQAQKHVTHNEALIRLDGIVQLSCIELARETPPETPNQNDRYCIGLNPNGVWQNKANQIAVYQDKAWMFYRPNEGWTAWMQDQHAHYIFTNGDWVKTTDTNIDSETGPISTSGQLGVNAVADTSNRLVVKSDNVLFSHDDVTPGTGDIRFNMNKADTSQTASLLFQSNYQGYAEVGLMGDENFSVKVSDISGAWKYALTIDKETGRLTLPYSLNIGTSEQDGFLTISGMGGSQSVPNSMTLSIGTDIKNTTTSALFIAPLKTNSRLFFGTVGKKFTALNLSNVHTIENMPIFSTPDALRWGYSANAGFVIGRTGDTISHHASSVHGGKHKFYSNTGSYSRANEKLICEFNYDEVKVSTPIHCLNVLRLQAYAYANLPSPANVGLGAMIMVDDTTHGKFLAVCDGAAWKKIDLLPLP